MSDNIVRKGEATAFERWDVPIMEEGMDEPELEILASIDDLDKPAPVELSEEEQALEEERQREEALTALRNQAYDEGLAAGREAGLAAAREDAEAIRAEAQDDIASQREHLAAEQARLEAAQQKLAADSEQMQAMLAAMSEPLKHIDEQVEEQLVELCLAISQQLVHRELKTETGEIVAVVREAVSVLPLSKNEVEIYLHPEDLIIVREALSLDDGKSHLWQLLEDPLLTRGGCRVVSEDSHVDASVEGRLRAVATRLLGGEREDDRRA